ncbi:MAG TPA: COX15/CtaA family protein [Xanthomonadaceae bacterium]|nr:COX15/CtaA family protein [Xanthomonadaceae bacterium]
MNATRNERAIGYWLLACCAVLLALVMLGGATRLTGSGLSIVDWRPVTGVLPPMNETAWLVEFDKYRQSPEYQKVNRGMSLDEFKTIFYYEYWHRVLARLLGLVFALPLAWFWLRGRIPRHLRWPLLGLLALGAAQGWMGWFMVQSGLVDIPRVSPYRLAAHLSLALVIYAGMFWLALKLLWPQAQAGTRSRAFPALLTLVAFTILSGAFVAGLKAGYVYNTFPLMDGRLVPTGVLYLEPAWRNFFENPATVQFMHRCLAIGTLLAVLAAWLVGWRRLAPGPARFALHALLAITLMQVALGIATLLLYVPVWLGTLHQGGAVIVLSAVLVLGHVVRSRAALGDVRNATGPGLEAGEDASRSHAL